MILELYQGGKGRAYVGCDINTRDSSQVGIVKDLKCESRLMLFVISFLWTVIREIVAENETAYVSVIG
mgnify:FL=1